MYPVFASYLNIFEYSPQLIEKWLEYAFWLRYDCLVLDCLKVNHLYGGSLIGALEWTYLDNELRLAYFNKTSMLEVWYTFKEYKKWVIEVAAYDEPDLTDINYTQFNIENLTPQKVDKCLLLLEQKDLLTTVSEIQFGQDEEIGGVEEEQGEDDNEDNEADSDETAKPKSKVTNKKRTASKSLGNDSVRKNRNQLTNMSVIRTIKSTEFMKNLRKISVRGEQLYELLINFHGFRDNPGKTISYIVKRRINEIQLSRTDQISRTGLADFTRWDNLRILVLSRMAYVDLNKIVFPKNLKSLKMEYISQIKWWEIEENIRKELNMDKKTFKSSYIREKNNRFTRFLGLSQIKIMELDKSEIDQITFFRCQALVWQSFGTLNHIRLERVSKVCNDNIIVPRALFYSKRIEIFQCEEISEVMVI